MMQTQSSEARTLLRRALMRYRADDFLLYSLSLLLTGALIFLIVPNVIGRVALLGACMYLLVSFYRKHGAKLDGRTLGVVIDGMARYPGILARSWFAGRTAIFPVAAIFLIVLAIEHQLRHHLHDTVWLKPFPWAWAVWIPFSFLTAFRLVILVSHLLRAPLVRQFLEDSPLQKTIAVGSIQHHLFHAFITGMLANLTLVAPCVLFYMFTDPSILREALLLAGFAAWSAIAMLLKRHKIIESESIIGHQLFYINHTIAHESRFFFTIFHGHHHDAIPSALIGSAGGTGFLENTDRALIWLEPLNSILVNQYNWTVGIFIDMVVHQYIPGVFPFAKATVDGAAHHVTHHFGSALPMGMMFRHYVERRDLTNGYKPDNLVTRWFLDEVQRREGLNGEVRRKFLSLGDEERANA